MSAFEEIQVGYTVRSIRNGVTREGIVEAIGPRSAHTKWPVVEIANVEDDSIEIVDRPKPAVVLPSVPTLGWLNSIGNAHALGIWCSRALTGGEGVENIRGDGNRALNFEITAFTEAVAVPKWALETLLGNVDCSGPLLCLQEHLDDFLAAIDNASTR